MNTSALHASSLDLGHLDGPVAPQGDADVGRVSGTIATSDRPIDEEETASLSRYANREQVRLI